MNRLLLSGRAGPNQNGAQAKWKLITVIEEMAKKSEKRKTVKTQFC